MAPQSYQGVRVVLAEPTAEMGGVINTALFPRGLREFATCRDADGLYEALEEQPADVLMCDIDLPGFDFRTTMQRIRHREIGANPFLHIVAMVSLSGRDQIQRLIGAGVDDLIRKPMPPARIASRFDAMARPRKPFVVAEEYVGPNRRKALRRGDGYRFIDVPNSLRGKLVDHVHPSQIQRAVAYAWREVAERQAGFKQEAINTLTARIMSYYDAGGSEANLHRDLGYLVSKAEIIVERHHDSGTAHVAGIAACMMEVARRILEAPTRPRRKDLRLMPHLSVAARKSAVAPDEAIGTVLDITQLIRNYLGES